MRRRTLLVGAGGVVLAAVAAAYHRREPGFNPSVPDAPAGDERVDRQYSARRGRTVDFYTAVPAGHGDGRGLPVCLVLHGATARPADFVRLGFGRFLTDAVRRGTPPFVLAGADGGRLSWRPNGGDDPQRMVYEEIPVWCRRRGFDVTRRALWGWSMGGYGSLLLAEAFPGFARAVAVFSPAVSRGDDVTGATRLLRGTPVGVWCGRQDALYPEVQALVKALPQPPAAGTYADGRHNFAYWSRCIPAAFDFIGHHLTR
jgi:predicted peptidase